jgi:ABC-type multidrug transport system fused ATPase/permease subunit
MDIFYYLLKKFYGEESFKILLLLFVSFSTNVFQINGISFITAKILQGIETSNFKSVYENFYKFIYVSVFFIILYHCYRILQNDILIKLRNWVKKEIVRLVLHANNESMNQVNFVSLAPPTQRIGAAAYMIFSKVFSTLIPDMSFLIMISLYFFYKNPLFGSIFFVSNLLIIFYVYIVWNDMMNYKKVYEASFTRDESYIIDLYNNMEKIIYRGQAEIEMNNIENKTKETITKMLDFHTFSNNQVFYMVFYLYLIIFASIYYLTILRTSNKIDKTTFVALFTVLLLYRSKMENSIDDIPEYINYFGRADFVLTLFNKYVDAIQDTNKNYITHELKFDKITFKNVTFQYQNSSKKVFDNMNITLDTNNKIIGVTGLSGNGKTTFIKLFLKLYKCNRGEILIDDVNIEKIDNAYIRKNITYVNQTSKLFSKKVIDNILYACNNIHDCNNHLDEVMKYPKIAQLYKNIDIYEKDSGSLGENLSGGQRQITNIISGLINPSKILILDEPTNALDPELKRELLSIIKDFKRHKKCIIIITHDKEVYPLFDETIHI